MTGNLLHDNSEAWGDISFEMQHGPILVDNQGAHAALTGDGTAWFVSFDTVSWADPKPIHELETTMFNSRKAIKVWPQTNEFASYKVGPVAIRRAAGAGN